jgi:signal transduction histidine kinase
MSFALTAIAAVLLRRGQGVTAIAYAELVVDQVTWTVLAYVTGGLSSGATSLYGLTCVIGAVAAGVRGVIVASGAAATLLLAMAVSFARGWLAPPHDQNTTTYLTRWKDLSYYVTLNMLVLVVVAILAGYLAARLRATGGQLAEATARAEQAERLAMLGRFAAGLAHEIRNPLGSIAGSIDLLKTNPTITEEDKLLCDIVSREASRLNDLVTDMLDLAKPRAPEPTIVDLARVSSEVVRLAMQSGRGSDVKVRYEGDAEGVHVSADPAQLRQLLWNLVRNAVQASGAGSRVTVHVARRGGDVLCEVSDQGEGIPESAREQLFDAFFTTRTQGIGIGLAIVKRVAEDHGWRLEVDSAAGRGATFRVVMPSVPA